VATREVFASHCRLHRAIHGGAAKVVGPSAAYLRR
jgi:hypothetical protein